MKNHEVIALVNNGALTITYHSLPAEHAYKVLRFRRALEKAAKEIDELVKRVPKDCDVEDPAAFDKELQQLRTDPVANAERLVQMENQLSRIQEMRTQIYNDEAHLEGVRTLPYEVWHALGQENRAVKVVGRDGTPREVDLFRVFEDALEGVLWEAPQE